MDPVKFVHSKFWGMDRDRQTDRQNATLNYEISTVWGTEPRMTPQKTSGLLMGPEEVTMYKTLQAV